MLGRFTAVAVSLASLLVPALASAQVVESPGPRRVDPSVYPVELEPHFTFGSGSVYGTAGVGAGMRATIPLAAHMLRRIPDNLAITFGGDFLRFDNCFSAGYCGVSSLILPVAAQWNVFVARRVSIFGEGGVFAYKAWFDPCRAGDIGCAAPADFGVLPTLAIGGRARIGENAAFLARIGYPTITLGVSFL
jgi:hypothetical protein